MLEVNEIFGPTIQGEGKKVGFPSVFVRFGKCNMTCAGFEVEYETPSGIKKCSCDSFYASDIAFRDEWQKYTTAESLIEEVDKLLPNYKVDIVLTGGEPLLYWNDTEFQKFMKHYVEGGYHLTIETNGSIDIELKEEWQKNLTIYIQKRLSIRIFVHLVDARHPFLEIDQAVHDYLQSIVRPDQKIMRIFTKLDKLKQSDISVIKKHYPNALL